MDSEESDMPEGEGEDSENESALVPKSLFGGECEVGETYTVKVVGKYEDEVAIEHVPDSKEENSEPSDDTMEGAMGKMDMMAEGAPAPGGY